MSDHDPTDVTREAGVVRDDPAGGSVRVFVDVARSRRDMLSLLSLSTGFFGVSMLAGCGDGSSSL